MNTPPVDSSPVEVCIQADWQIISRRPTKSLGSHRSPHLLRAARLHAARTRSQLGFQTGANRTGAGSPGAAKRSHFVWLLSLQSGLLSSADRLSNKPRIHWRILLGTLRPSAGGPGGTRKLTVRGQCFSCSTQVGFKFDSALWGLCRQRRGSEIGTCSVAAGHGVDPGLRCHASPSPFPPFRLHNDGSRSGEDGLSSWLRSRIVGRISYQLLGSQHRSLCGLALDISFFVLRAALLADSMQRCVFRADLGVPAAAVCGRSFLNALIPRCYWNADCFSPS